MGGEIAAAGLDGCHDHRQNASYALVNLWGFICFPIFAQGPHNTMVCFLAVQMVVRWSNNNPVFVDEDMTPSN